MVINPFSYASIKSVKANILTVVIKDHVSVEKKNISVAKKGEIQYLINKIKQRQKEYVQVKNKIQSIFNELINQLKELKQNILIKLQKSFVDPQIQKAQKQLIESGNLFDSINQVQLKEISQKQSQQYFLKSSQISMIWQSLHKIQPELQKKKVQNEINQLIEKYYENQFKSIHIFEIQFDKFQDWDSINVIKKESSEVNFIKKKTSIVTIGDQMVNFYFLECANCGEQLIYPFYWCRWEQDSSEFRCRQCIQLLSNNNILKNSYNKNSILLFQQPVSLNIKRMGSNIQPKSSQQMQIHKYKCNGCLPHTKGKHDPRYICLECDLPKGDFVDICPDCVQLMIKKDKNVLQKLHEKKHQENHALLRIRYNVNGYYNY